MHFKVFGVFKATLGAVLNPEGQMQMITRMSKWPQRCVAEISQDGKSVNTECVVWQKRNKSLLTATVKLCTVQSCTQEMIVLVLYKASFNFVNIS